MSKKEKWIVIDNDIYYDDEDDLTEEEAEYIKRENERELRALNSSYWLSQF